MQLIELTIKDFLATLGSKTPAPGGGSASALSGAMGIALTRMVAELTVGKKKYAEHEAVMQEVLASSTQLQRDLTEAIDKDTEAFNHVAAVFAMPKATDEEKAARKMAMQEALRLSAQVPLEMMTTLVAGLEITQKAVGKSNVNAASDLGVAALDLTSGLQGAWLNVLINLSGIDDEEFKADLHQKGQALLTKGQAIGQEIYLTILDQL